MTTSNIEEYYNEMENNAAAMLTANIEEYYIKKVDDDAMSMAYLQKYDTTLLQK